jgi:hypothetical protein
MSRIYVSLYRRLYFFAGEEYNKSMLVKTLSVKQPYAAFICAGIKTVENRT